MQNLVRTRAPSRPLSQTLEREIAQILTQVAPRRQQEGQTCRVISVLCVQISDFVAHCEQIEPEDVATILGLYVGAMADSVGTYFGTMHATMGDCILASWNAAHPQPDHALLAVSAAIDMIERTDDMNLRLQGDRLAGSAVSGSGVGPGLPEIACAIGINTGDALVCPARVRGTSLQAAAGSVRGELEIIGDTVNVARLLASVAPPGGILIAEGTKVSLGGEILLEPTEITMLPGKKKPVRVFRVLGRLSAL